MFYLPVSHWPVFTLTRAGSSLLVVGLLVDKDNVISDQLVVSFVYKNLDQFEGGHQLLIRPTVLTNSRVDTNC